MKKVQGENRNVNLWSIGDDALFNTLAAKHVRIREEIDFQIRQISMRSRIFGTPEENSIDAGAVMLKRGGHGCQSKRQIFIEKIYESSIESSSGAGMH